MARTIRKMLLVGAAVTAATTAALMPPASADTFLGNASSSASNYASVGSVTTQNVIESYASGWNAGVGTFDAAVPRSGSPLTPTTKWADFCGTLPVGTVAPTRCGSVVPTASNTINTKKTVTGKNCTAIPRPTGSSDGITTLNSLAVSATSGCVDIARSSRGPKTGSAACTTSQTWCNAFYAFGRDAVAWSSLDTAAPTFLTPSALQKIYTCATGYRNFNTIPAAEGGNSNTATIKPVLPQSGSGTRSFFLAAIGVTTPGACVLQPATSLENDGTSIRTVAGCPASGSCAGVVSPYSVADYIAQRKVGLNEANKPTNVTDVRAGIVLRNIKATSTSTTTTSPCTTGNCSAAGQTLNVSYGSGTTPGFVRTVYNVVRATNTGVVATNLQYLFNPSTTTIKGYICLNPSKITQYGFATAASCGARTLVGVSPAP